MDPTTSDAGTTARRARQHLVRLDADELTHPLLLDRLVRVLDRAGLAPQQVSLRLEGPLALADAGRLLAAGAAVRDLGIAFEVAEAPAG